MRSTTHSSAPPCPCGRGIPRPRARGDDRGARRDGDGLRRGVAHRGLPHDREGLRDRASRHEGRVQLRRLLDARAPDHRGRARRRVRLGGRGEHEEGRGRRRRRRCAAAVRRQSPRDHRAARQPEAGEGLADLARPGMVISLAAPAVPVGHYAVEAFGKAGVPVPSASKEADVKAVVTRVSMGEADAGVVYVTDVAAGGDKVEAVAIPDAHNVTARYPIATLEHAPNAAGAQAFVAYVLSPPGQSVLDARRLPRPVTPPAGGGGHPAGRGARRRARRRAVRPPAPRPAVARAVGRPRRGAPRAGSADGDAALARLLARRHRAVDRAGLAAGVGPGARPLPRAIDPAGADAAARSCCRPSSAASRCCPSSGGAV